MKNLIALILSLITASLFAQQIYQTDCNSFNPWLTATAQTDVTAITAQALWSATGTIDAPNTNAPTGSLALTVNNGSSTQNWAATLKSDFIYVENTVTNLGLLTLSFDHSVTELRPVTVQIESYDQNKNRTGGLEAQVEPAAANFYIRSAVDLSMMKPFGAGTFQPTNPYIRISFKITALPSYIAPVATQTLRIDNIAYSSPKYYVAAVNGSDANDGLTESTPFKTVQKAVNLTQAGDIVVVRAGIYNGGTSSAANFPRAGTPAAWIVLRGYPNEKATLMSSQFNLINIGKGSSSNLDNSTILAYLEIRNLHVLGNGPAIYDRDKSKPVIDTFSAERNTNGITTNGYYMAFPPHHIRIANNLVEFLPAGGIGTLETDRIQIENNIVRNCGYTNTYGTSNISTLGSSNFDNSTDYKILIRNNISSGCENKSICASAGCKGGSTPSGRYTDGNGIIIDVNENTQWGKGTKIFSGRTLVQNNLVFNNGGGGIHNVNASRVDVINNTSYLNSASPELEYSEMGAGFGTKDCRFINNIMVAPVSTNPLKPQPINRYTIRSGTYITTNTTQLTETYKIIYGNNIYFGGNIAPIMGTGDSIAEPKFVNPSTDDAIADFRPKSNSPVIGRGTTAYSFMPRLDLYGNVRRINGANPSIGAGEYVLGTSVIPLEKEVFTVSPNPTNGLISINGLKSTAEIELFDMSGRKVLGKILDTNSTTIDVSKLNQGIYVYKIKVEKRFVQSGKIVKQ